MEVPLVCLYSQLCRVLCCLSVECWKGYFGMNMNADTLVIWFKQYLLDQPNT